MNPDSVAVGDFDGDGVQDLATTSSVASEVSVLLGLGNGGFAPRVAYSVSFLTPGGVRGVATADIDEDGDLDLAVSQWLTDQVALLPGNGDGSFGSA